MVRAMRRREAPVPLGPGLIRKRPLVATTTLSRALRDASQAPKTRSERPSCPYTSAVSTKLTPASSARSRMAKVSSWLDETLCIIDFSSASPKVMAPRQSTETCVPVVPSWR